MGRFQTDTPNIKVPYFNVCVQATSKLPNRRLVSAAENFQAAGNSYTILNTLLYTDMHSKWGSAYRVIFCIQLCIQICVLHRAGYTTLYSEYNHVCRSIFCIQVCVRQHVPWTKSIHIQKCIPYTIAWEELHSVSRFVIGTYTPYTLLHAEIY